MTVVKQNLEGQMTEVKQRLDNGLGQLEESITRLETVESTQRQIMGVVEKLGGSLNGVDGSFEEVERRSSAVESVEMEERTRGTGLRKRARRTTGAFAACQRKISCLFI